MPTQAALRAARASLEHALEEEVAGPTAERTIQGMAEIIDKETGLLDLLAAAEDGLAALQHQASKGDMWFPEIDTLVAAIRKVKAE